MKTAISIPDELFDRAEAFARQRGLNRSELYQRAIQNFLEAEQGGFVREALNRVYGVEPGVLDEAAMAAQSDIIEPEDW